MKNNAFHASLLLLCGLIACNLLSSETRSVVILEATPQPTTVSPSRTPPSSISPVPTFTSSPPVHDQPTATASLTALPLPALEIRPDGAERLSAPPGGASDQNPAFSPKALPGMRLVFTRFENGYNDGPAGLFLLDLATLQVDRLTPWEDQDNVNLPGSAWNPLNNRIVFASDRTEADDLWRIAPDGGDFTRITTHDGLPWYIEPSWSPDGEWIVFEARQPAPSEDGYRGQIWKVHADGSGKTQLTADAAFDDRQPNWSPTGERILFQRRALPDGQWDVYTIDPDGAGLFNVTDNPAADTDASWSPDGRWIVVSSDYAEQVSGELPAPNLFAYPSGGGAPLRVTSSATQEDGAPSWSPDGLWIAFESHTGQDEDTPASLWRIRAPGLAKLFLPYILSSN